MPTISEAKGDPSNGDAAQSQEKKEDKQMKNSQLKDNLEDDTKESDKLLEDGNYPKKNRFFPFSFFIPAICIIQFSFRVTGGSDRQSRGRIKGKPYQRLEWRSEQREAPFGWRLWQ
jgi:hypothetical protein